jgi:hypothetical protein
MSRLLLLPPSIISNSAIVNQLSIEEVRMLSPPFVNFLICIELPFLDQIRLL